MYHKVDVVTTAVTVCTLIALQKKQTQMRLDFSRNDGLPRPRGDLTLKDSDPYRPDVELFEGSLRHYPIQLIGVRRGDSLRAHFNCYLPDIETPALVRMGASALAREDKFLPLHKDEPVADWNRVQIKLGRRFMELLPEHGRFGVNEQVIASLRRTPETFKGALMDWMINAIAS